MSDFQELEVKLLNIDIDKMKRKLDEIGATYIHEVVQKIYTYDCYAPILMYRLAINDYEITKSNNSLKKIANIVSQIEPVIMEEEKIKIKGILGTESISEYILNKNFNVSVEKLKNNYIENVIKNSEKRFFKWIRLRESGKKVELTIKYIYNVNTEYNIEDVKEIEVNVSSFEVANKLLEEMGYFRKKLVEKKRISYKYNAVNIEIDKWPLINPYMEIEGKNEIDIYSTVEKLGFKKEDTKIMNTEDVYLNEGKNINDFELLTFNEQVEINS